ncbi:transglycosylase SLT domain-containing protein [Streptomyces sp. NPDC014733]|uniref:transglycosylase SLT domain-containing protein n=1 Tax=Streptomyces sp. NPDC014733 TaxID=3364885 RepID=UPI003701DAE5
MAGTDRSAIKVGSGYVEIAPRIAREALAKFRTDLKTTLVKAGEEAGKGFSQAATKGLSSLPKAAAAAAKKATAEIEASAKKTAQSVLRVEQGLTKQLGKETTKRLRDDKQLATERGQLHNQVARTAKEALDRTMRAETQAGEHATRTQQKTEQARIREIGQREQRAVAAERAQQTAQRQAREEGTRGDRLAADSSRTMQRQRVQSAREAEREIREEARRTGLAMQAARRADLENQIHAQTQISANLRQQIAGYNQHVQRLEANTNQSILRVRDSLRKTGSGIDEVGSSASEAGRLITHNLLAPLTLVSSVLTTIGVKAADSFKTLELGLQGMKLNQRDINNLSRNMTNYAVATPYSLEDMQNYSTRFARVFTSHGSSSKGAAQKTEHVIKAVGDNAAASGILDPQMVARGLYALTIMGDTDRVNMRNLKQFEASTGMPAEELATMMGFESDKKHKTAFAAMAAAMQDPKKSGGVSGVEFIDKIIEHWQGSDREGAAAKIGAQTITGRVQSLQERARLGLSDLFINRGEGDKPSQYTELGQKLMGDDGVLDQVTKLGSSVAKSGVAEDTLKAFFDVISELTSWAQETVDFVRQHPAIKDALLIFAKIAAVAAPLLIGMGVLTKTVGKLTKLAGSGLRPAAAGARGARGGVRAGRQFFAGTRSWAEGGTFREGYRAKRTELRGGDERGPVRRATDRVRGRNSQVEQIQVQTGEAERALRQSEQRTQALRDALQQVNRTSLDGIVNQLAGSAGGRSVSAAASSAQREVRSVITQGTTPLNNEGLGRLQGEFRQTGTTAEGLKGKVSSAAREVSQLNDRKLVSLRLQFDTTEGTVQDLKDKVQNAALAVSSLNKKTTGALKGQFSSLRDEVSSTKRSVDSASGRVSALNGKTLSGVRSQFKGLDSSVSDVSKSIGTAKSPGSVSGRITNLNARSLSTVTGKVNTLKAALNEAAEKADRLGRNIKDVNVATGVGGGSGKGKSKGKKFAQGGVLPGYAPGVDNIPAVLSPGEAILRPEVTAHLGEHTIHAWNQAAVRGRLSRFAKGGVAGGRGRGGGRRWPFSILDELTSSIDLSSGFAAFGGGIDMAAAGSKIGGQSGSNVRRWGAHAGGDASGRAANDRFANLRQFMFSRLPDFLKATPTGIGNVIGLAAGAVAPTAGQLFWDDVWKGQGNILQRGAKFTKDLLSPSNLLEMIKDLFSGVADMVKGLGSLAKDLITNPKKVLDEAISTFTDLFNGVIDSVKSMIDLVGKILGNPSEFAGEVWDSFYERAKESLPNTEGLFKFASGGIVPGYSPDDDRVRALLSPGEAVLRPEAVRALGVQTVMDLNRNAKRGNLGTSKKNETSKAIIPAPDAEAFEDAVDRIEVSLGDGGEAVKAMQSQLNSSWKDTASKVRSSVDSSIRPALNRMQREMAGPTASSLKSLTNTSRSSWSSIQGQASTSSRNAIGSMSSLQKGASTASRQVRGSFSEMQSGLSSLERSFDTSRRNIGTSMNKVPTAVKSNVREAVNFIQRAMISPVNSKLLAPAKLDKIADLPKYAEGGVLPGFAPGRDSILAVLSPGESILRPEVTRALGAETIHSLNGAAMAGRLPRFATGGVLSAWGKADESFPGMFADTANPILKKVLDAFLDGIGQGDWAGAIGGAGAKKSKSAISKILENQDESFVGDLSAFDSLPGNAVTRWTPLVQRALKELGLSLKYTNLILHRIRVESGGNPKAINNWDINAINGVPSQGLMQTIPPTFAAYAGPYRKLGITNPLASIYAGINYATHRYGKNWTRALSGTSGYWTGTLSASPGLSLVGENGPELIDFRGGERVYSDRRTRDLLSDQDKRYEIHIHEAKSEDTTQAVLRAMQYAEAMYGR